MSSDLLVAEYPKPPAPEPAEVCRISGPLEIRDGANRELARKALLDIAKAMNLRGGGRFEREKWEAHWQAWRYLGTMLLGSECPDIEVNC